MKPTLSTVTSVVMLTSIGVAAAQTPTENAVPVTVDNFTRAESDLYLGNAVRDAGGIGKLAHRREPVPIDQQAVIRPNRDTLYSSAVVDLDAGPATVTLPDAGRHVMSMQVINQDHYVVGKVVYHQGAYSYDRKRAGTRYVLIALRTLVDANDPKDVRQVHALQDAVRISQRGRGRFEVPNWDQAGQQKVRDALRQLGATLPDFKRAFGVTGEVDPTRHLIGTAVDWGGRPDRDATDLNVTPLNNDGDTIYRLKAGNVPVDGFWSVSVYNADGHFEPNAQNAYAINSVMAKKDVDGSVAVQFGGCSARIPNCLPIVKGWQYTVRLYRPHLRVLDGTWKFPAARPVETQGARR